MKFRLLTTDLRSGAENMAIDEAVLDQISTGESLPTLRFYGWQPATISIGYFQSLEEEVDTGACRNHGVDVVRRITGGGAVLHEHEITYSIHIPEKSSSTMGIPEGILESYAKICGGVIKGLSHLGITAQFVPLNDLIVVHNGAPRKISGNAQTRKKGVILQHGTILLKVDVDKMFALLKVPSEKMKGKLIEDVKQRVTSLEIVRGAPVSFHEALLALTKGFKEEFSGVDFVEGELSHDEKMLSKKYAEGKYGADSWIKNR